MICNITAYIQAFISSVTLTIFFWGRKLLFWLRHKLPLQIWAELLKIKQKVRAVAGVFTQVSWAPDQLSYLEIALPLLGTKNASSEHVPGSHYICSRAPARSVRCSAGSPVWETALFVGFFFSYSWTAWSERGGKPPSLYHKESCKDMGEKLRLFSNRSLTRVFSSIMTECRKKKGG